MNVNEFNELIKNIVYLDGATGSELSKRGMPAGVCPEKWIMDNSDIMYQLQTEYFDAGSNIILAPTFTANRIKLAEYGLQDDIVNINKTLAGISLKVRDDYRKNHPDSKVFVAADMTMTGVQLIPVGNYDFEDLVNVYKEQVSILLETDIDLFIIETMTSLQETRAALIAVKELCNLPVLCSLTFQDDGKTMYGNDAVTSVGVLQSLGADAIGANCSVGPDKLIEIIKQMSEIANVPIIAKPNAGMPQLDENNNTVYTLGPELFSIYMQDIIDAGASIIGGCCGTTPEHISELNKLTKSNNKKPSIIRNKKRYISSERTTLLFDIDSPFMIVGERINPTGKKALQEELRNGSLNIIRNFAEEQEQCGASLLDINVGMGGIDEKTMMMEAINEVTMVTNLPLVLDSSSVDVLENALRRYPGRALVNSVSLESVKINDLLPIVKKYGAMFILLPLSDAGLPKDLNEKKHIINTIFDKALSLGFDKNDIVVDGLVTTVGANPKAALETLETINYCKNILGLPTICGLSNISFGLPERVNINSSFLNLAIKEGLTMAIMNPSQKQLVTGALATDMLLNKQNSDLRYINYVNQEKNEEIIKDLVYKCVLIGDKKQIIDYTKDRLSNGIKAGDILNSSLLPAINEVGKLFEKGKYFLPQLIKSAEAMKTAIEYLEPLLQEQNNSGRKIVIVIATVKGDIHDIGKNLVALMLKNYGFDVIDLGKDVPSSDIINVAKEKNADVIALSALMTTTMVEMKNVIDMVHSAGLKAKVIVGGAVITQDYADLIGADGYSKDAQDAVSLVSRLTNS